jgi:4-hydroxybenzoate polyprenyltransferase
MIKIVHTVFALPFAIMGAVLAARGIPPLATLAWILVAMVGARTAAMAWNRVADARIDAANPRTADRSIPAGRISTGAGVALTVVAAGVFVLAAGMLNPLCLALSPVALVVFLGYPYTKRFSAGSHLVLGIALGLSPLGAWVAVTGAFGAGVESAVLLGLAVVLWVAGFDVIYACQDHDHDVTQPGLHSIPKRLGVSGALRLARLLHLAALGLLAGVGFAADLGWVYAVGVVAAAGLLHHEHGLVRKHGLEKVGVAFLNVNGAVSIVVGGLGIVDVLVG